jgi:hypothetical protein
MCALAGTCSKCLVNSPIRSKISDIQHTIDLGHGQETSLLPFTLRSMCTSVDCCPHPISSAPIYLHGFQTNLIFSLHVDIMGSIENSHHGRAKSSKPFGSCALKHSSHDDHAQDAAKYFSPYVRSRTFIMTECESEKSISHCVSSFHVRTTIRFG